MSTRERYTLEDLKAAWPEVERGLRPRPRTTRTTVTPGVASTYAEAALAYEAQAILDARKGSRNHAANRAAFNIGTLVGAGALDEGDAYQTLLTAALSAQDALPEHEATNTIRRGLRAGMKHPRAGVA